MLTQRLLPLAVELKLCSPLSSADGEGLLEDGCGFRLCESWKLLGFPLPLLSLLPDHQNCADLSACTTTSHHAWPGCR